MYRDDIADPPAIVCQVGSTQLKYDARAIEDLHAMLNTADEILAKAVNKTQAARH
jgi:hypothetical protein